MLDVDTPERQTPASIAERRGETRWPAGAPAVVTILSTRESLAAKTVNVSNAGVRVRLAEPLAVSEAVRVDYRDTEIFGVACWCKQLHRASHDAGILVKVRLTRR